MPRRTKEEAEQTREAILCSALELFYEKGFARTTFDEIAKRINLTKGAVYWHFRNKADLLAELIRDKMAEKKLQMQLHETEVDSVAGLRAVFEHAALSIENDAEYCKFLFFIIFHMEWSEIVANHIFMQLHELVEYPRTWLKEKLSEMQKKGEIIAGVDVDEIAVILLCLWRGSLDTFVSKRVPINFSKEFLQGFDLIMNSLKMESK